MEYINAITSFLLKVMNLILADIEFLRWEAYFFLAVVFLIPYFISRYFEAIIFRIICILFGLALLSSWQQEAILRDFNFLIGIALIVPHIRYFYEYIRGIIFSIINYFINLFISIKNTTLNTYYFFLTIYYKVIRVIKWIINIFNSLMIFFKLKKSTYKEENSYSDYSSNSFYKENNNSYDNSYNHYEKKEYSKKEQKYSYNEDNSYKKQENYKNDNSYKSEYKSSYKEKEQDLDNNSNSKNNKYARFYSPSAYIVLGVNVNSNDDFKTIKKSYRDLIREYHPDRNIENTKLFTEISQNINSAYEKLKKIHKE